MVEIEGHIRFDQKVGHRNDQVVLAVRIEQVTHHQAILPSDQFEEKLSVFGFFFEYIICIATPFVQWLCAGSSSIEWLDAAKRTTKTESISIVKVGNIGGGGENVGHFPRDKLN